MKKILVFWFSLLAGQASLWGQEEAAVETDWLIKWNLEGTVRTRVAVEASGIKGFWDSDFEQKGYGGLEGSWFTAGPLLDRGLRKIRDSWSSLNARSSVWGQEARTSLTTLSWAPQGLGFFFPGGGTGLWIKSNEEGWKVLGGWEQTGWGLDAVWGSGGGGPELWALSPRGRWDTEAWSFTWAGWYQIENKVTDKGGAFHWSWFQNDLGASVAGGLLHDDERLWGWGSWSFQWGDSLGLWTLRQKEGEGPLDVLYSWEGLERWRQTWKNEDLGFDWEFEHEENIIFSPRGLRQVSSNAQAGLKIRKTDWSGGGLFLLKQVFNPEWQVGYKAEIFGGWRGTLSQILCTIDYTDYGKPQWKGQMEIGVREDPWTLRIKAGMEGYSQDLALGPRSWEPFLDLLVTIHLRK